MVKLALSPMKTPSKSKTKRNHKRKELWPTGGTSYNELTEDNFLQRAVQLQAVDREIPFFCDAPQLDVSEGSRSSKRAKLNGEEAKVCTKKSLSSDYQLLYSDVSSETSVEIPKKVTKKKRRGIKRSIKRILTPKLSKSRKRFNPISSSSDKSRNNNANKNIPGDSENKASAEGKAKISKSADQTREKRFEEESSSSFANKNSNAKKCTVTVTSQDELDTSLDKLLRPEDAIIDTDFHNVIDGSYESPSASNPQTSNVQQQPKAEPAAVEEPPSRGLFSGCLAFLREKFSRSRHRDAS